MRRSKAADKPRPLPDVFTTSDWNSLEVLGIGSGDEVIIQTRAIIAVHLAGWPYDMDAILELAHKRGLKIIEDCAQAHGVSYMGRPVGSMGDANAFALDFRA